MKIIQYVDNDALKKHKPEVPQSTQSTIQLFVKELKNSLVSTTSYLTAQLTLLNMSSRNDDLEKQEVIAAVSKPTA